MFSGLKRSVCRTFKIQALNSGLIYFIIISLLVFILMEGFFFLERRLRPVIISIAEVRAHALAIEAVNEAVMDSITDDQIYNELISIKQDEQGKIIMAQINTLEVNRLIARTTIAIQDTLTSLMREPFRLPLGAVFDNYLLATYGPGIPIKLIPVGKVSTLVRDSFEDAGINQVRHKIYLDITAEVRIAVPLIVSETKVHTTVPLADAIYPGKVPETVINLNLQGSNPGIIPEQGY
ncbi:MAG: sporulation protein YunB [Dethiobacteria bacterium]|jgi:sporulation protein YunB